MTEIIDQIRSEFLGNERSVWIHPPQDRTTATNLTVFLDAEIYRGHVGAGAVLNQMQGRLADSWFVFVSMHSVEARTRECPCHPPFAQFLAKELLPWLEGRFPELKIVRQRVLVGLSYTGLAAAFAALIQPGHFQKVIAQSGSFWWRDGWLGEQVRQLAQPLPTEFYLTVGTRETQENVRHSPEVLQVVSQIAGVQRFRDALRDRGHLVQYAECDSGHYAECWRMTLPAALEWALPVAQSETSARAVNQPERSDGP